ncbi:MULTISPECIES: hypothetical protein [unclassified Marinovum]|uniref:hypothetical protein n=1 Tax=unclassified Marinovum TaxID=2647166 RepID=UPI003EDC4FFD
MTFNPKDLRAALLAAELRHQFTEWLRSEAEQFVSAADLLGGHRWACRAEKVVGAIADGSEPEDVEADLAALHGLLTLEFSNDIHSHMAVRFFSMHPDDPRAEEVRLCAEALEKGLDAMRGACISDCS